MPVEDRTNIMLNPAAIKRDWFSNVRADALAGIVVALALIPEAIGFSVIVGVDPRVGLYASFSIAVIIAFVGGRQGMISAATASVAVIIIPLVKQYGVEYLFAAPRSEEHTSELQSLMRLSYAVFCLKQKHTKTTQHQLTANS